MIDTWSGFNFDLKIDAQPYTGYINIDEGAGELTISLPVGSYTLGTLVGALRNALVSQGTLDYEVTLDRATRRYTISAPTPFTLLTASGANSFLSAYSLLGFSSDADKTGATSYTSDIPAGTTYEPQFKLQSYVPPEHFQARNQSSKNVASDGTTVEVVNFGIAKFIEFEIKYIHSVPGIADGQYIRKNDTGLEDAIYFFQYVTELNEFEFVPDMDKPGIFHRVIVESMPGFGDGTGYKLRELFSENLRDVYNTGTIKLRVIE